MPRNTVSRRLMRSTRSLRASISTTSARAFSVSSLRTSIRALSTTASSSPSPRTLAAHDISVEEDDFSLRQLLTPAQSRVLDDIKGLLNTVPQHLATLGVSKEDSALLSSASSSLDELFLVVVVGEFNAGKSNFINALLGAKHCKTGVLPTTETVQILRYGPQREETVSTDESKSVRTVRLPVDWLKRASLVDTPGTNAVLRSHQTITEKFVPSADLILFITSVERPFSESEKQFLSRIYDWKKKVVIVLNKADLVVHDMEAAGIHNSTASATSSSSLASSSDAISPLGPSGIDIGAVDSLAYADGTPEVMTSFDQVVSFVRANAKSVLVESPPVFGVSSRLALAGKMATEEALAVLNGEVPSSGPSAGRKMSPASAAAAVAQGRALVANSGFLDLERHVLEELTAENKVRLKMENPLSVAEHLLKKYSTTFEAHAQAMVTDAQVRDLIRRELGEFSIESRSDVDRDLARLENVFLRIKAETTAFLSTQLRTGNLVPLLFNLESLRLKYNDKVYLDVTAEIDAIVSNVSNWIITKTGRQSQTLAAIMQRGAQATPAHSSSDDGVVSASTANVLPTVPSTLSSVSNGTSSTNATSTSASVATTSPSSESTPFNTAANVPSSGVSSTSSSTTMNGLNSINVAAQAERVRTAGLDYQQSRIQALQEMQRKVCALAAEDRRARDTSVLMDGMRASALLFVGLEFAAVACLAGAFVLPPAAIASAVLAGAGLAVMPAQRSRLARQANGKTDALFSSMRSTLSLQLNREIEDAARMLEQTTTPYCKWVQHEEERMLQIQQRFNALRGSIHKIRKELALFSPLPTQATQPIQPAISQAQTQTSSSTPSFSPSMLEPSVVVPAPGGTKMKMSL